MAVAKILLFYAFTPLPDPEALRLWQRDLCELLGLRGRILLAHTGINGTVGGELGALKKYVRKTKEFAPFRKIDFKWSDGSGLDNDNLSLDFPRLSVRVRDEIVTFGAPEELHVDPEGVTGGGQHLTPDELHQLLGTRDDVVFFDGRNRWEAEIGKFRDALVPPVESTREFVSELDRGTYDHLKNTPVVTYCTGGVRCEVLSGLMRSRGFTEVYQLDGGIVRYGERFGDSGLWEGSLYVFDGRGSVSFSDTPKVIGHCVVCGHSTDRMVNCTDAACRRQLVVCSTCQHSACEEHAALV